MTLPTIDQLEAMLADATPGPWLNGIQADEYSVDRSEEGYDGLCWSAVGTDAAVALVVVPCSFGMEDTQEANAMLISLAPSLATQCIADAKRIAELESMVTDLMQYVPMHVVECRGDKCREPWCASCNGREYAQEYVDGLRQRYA